MQLQNNIKLYDLECTVEREIYYSFSKYSLLIFFLRDIQKENLSLEDTYEENSQLVKELKDMG